MLLSRHVRLNPQAIDSSLQRLNCVSQGITEVDIHPTVLSLLTSVAPDVVRRAVAEMPPHDAGDSAKADPVDFSGVGFNTALALSLHTVLLSRNRITTTLGIVQFKNTVRLSLLGNRVQRIEDCEALSLLPSLQYLSLEFNPVTSLPHYRAHMLRICSWPEIFHQKNCRLRKLDAQTVLPAEVERAVQCLHREVVTIGELAHRMRFLALLTEAEKRIALHHELRRRGLLVQDIIVGLTVENVVTRCSTHLLTLVNVSIASHLARRLMGGKCRMCNITAETSRIDGTHKTVETSQEAHSLSHSFCSSNVFPLQNPHKANITAFCKDWSRDVFRSSLTSLDHRICGLLLGIAHALGEELTVMDVDHLNKLWLVQMRKVDGCNFYHRQDSAKPSTLPVRGELTWAEKESIKPVPQEELVRIVALSPGGAPRGSDAYVKVDSDNEAVSLRSISPIAPGATGHDSIIDGNNSKETSHNMLEDSRYGARQLDVNADMPCIEKIGEQNSETASVEPLPQPLHVPTPFPSPQKAEMLEQTLLAFLGRHTKKRVICEWRAKTWRKLQHVLCRKYVEKKVSELLMIAFPTLHTVCKTLQYLPRTERKRVLFHFWRREAWLSYAPRWFRVRSLLVRWRWRMYDEANIGVFSSGRRVRVLAAVWHRWRVALREKAAATRRSDDENRRKGMENATDKVSTIHLPAQGGPICLTTTPVNLWRQLKLSMMESQSRSMVETDAAQGLTCSTKPSVNDTSVARCVLHSEKTPGFTARLSSPTMTPISVVVSPTIRMPASCEKGTQASVELSHDDISMGCKSTPHAELEGVVQVMQADRLRLIDRLIELEQRVSEEVVSVQRRDEEIGTLKQKLAAMTVREECMKSTLNDYQREMEHLRAVVQALREERRELLRSAVS